MCNGRQPGTGTTQSVAFCFSLLIQNWHVLLKDNNSMINHAMDFYKNLFGKEQRSIRLEDDFWGEEERERE
jgi:hypothetical protein